MIFCCLVNNISRNTNYNFFFIQGLIYYKKEIYFNLIVLIFYIIKFHLLFEFENY